MAATSAKSDPGTCHIIQRFGKSLHIHGVVTLPLGVFSITVLPFYPADSKPVADSPIQTA
jgi:hypothetical protein